MDCNPLTTHALSEDRLSQVASRMPDPLAIYQPLHDASGAIEDFELVFANEAAAGAGIPALSQVGARIGTLPSSPAGPGLLEHLARVCETGEPRLLEDYEYPRRGGAPPLIFDVRLVPLGDEIAAIWRDVAERHRRQRELLEFRERFEMVAKATNDVVWDCDLRTGGASWSDALNRVLGLEPPAPGEDALEWWRAQVHPADLERIWTSLEHAMASGAARWSGEYRFRRNDGGWSDILDRAYIARDEAGQPVRLIGSFVDMTELRGVERERDHLLEREQRARREAERLLREREDLLAAARRSREEADLERSRLSTVIDVLPVGVWISGADGELVHGNDAACAIWGVRRIGELLEHAAEFGAWWPDGSPVALEAWGLPRAVTTGVSSGPEEVRIRRRSGEEKYILNFAVPIRGASGEIIGGVAVNVDLTEKKESERVINDQLAEIESIYHHATVGLCVLDRDLRYVRINKHMAEINGVPAAAHIGRSVHEIVPGLAREAEATLRRVLATGEPVIDNEISGETPAQPGVQRTWLEHWFPLTGLDGEVTGIIVVAEEVTARKAAERAIRESEYRQRHLARLSAVMSDPVTMRDRADALARVLTEDLYDVCVVDLVDDDGEIRRGAVRHRDPDQQARASALAGWAPESSGRIARAIQTREPVLIPVVTELLLTEAMDDEAHIEAARALRPVSAMVLPLVARGRAFGAISILSTRPETGFDPDDLAFAQDLVDRASLVLDNARLLDEATEAVKDREAVLATVSHDLRNPLSTVGMASALLLDDFLTPEKKAVQAKIIRNAIAQALRLIEDLLDVSRFRGGAVTLRTEALEPAALVDDALALAAAAAAEAGIPVRNATPQQPPLPQISGDRARLLQVLDNMVDNAIRHSPPGAAVDVAAFAADGAIRFEVRDAGPGIHPGDAPLVFDRFWQGASSKAGGAGLGLAIAKAVVEAHAGTIGVETAPGEGACFWFEIPRAPTGSR